jgi:tight adherence protein C
MGIMNTGLLIGAVTLLFLGVFALVVVLMSASFGRVGVARGLQTIDRVYAAGAQQLPTDENGERYVPVGPNGLARLGRATTSSGGLDRLRRWLDYAGNPQYWTVQRVFEIKAVALLLTAIVGAAVGLFAGSVLWAVIGGVAGLVIGYFLPDVIIYDLATRRQQKLRSTMPDILDTLTVSVEAGLGFDAALGQLTKYGRGPLAGEFARVLQEMQIGRSRVDALRAMSRRTKVTELRSFCAIVVQATELGIPIANVLREQAREMRVKRRQIAEEIAQKIPVKILFPLVFCLFPALFIVVLGPAALNIMDTLLGS